MKMTRRICLIVLFAGLLTGFFMNSAPEAQAIDPVTIAILTPIAIKAAQIAAPYVYRAFANMGKASLKIFPDLVGVFKLPVGIGMMLLGWPFQGAFVKGVLYTVQGFCAPFQLVWHTLMIPVAAFGINVNN